MNLVTMNWTKQDNIISGIQIYYHSITVHLKIRVLL